MIHSVASDLVLDCLLMSHKRDARLIWVNLFFIMETLRICILANSEDR